MGGFARHQVASLDGCPCGRKAGLVADEFSAELRANDRHVLELRGSHKYWRFHNAQIDSSAAVLVEQREQCCVFIRG